MWGTADNPVPKRRHLWKPDGQEFAHFRLSFSHSSDKNRLEIAVSRFGYTEVECAVRAGKSEAAAPNRGPGRSQFPSSLKHIPDNSLLV